MRSSVLAIVLLFFVLSSSCKQQPLTSPMIEDTAVVESPFDKVWGAAVATFAEMSMPIESIEKESGLITTSFVTYGGDIDDIAETRGSWLSVWKNCRYTVNMFATPVSEVRTKIKVNVHIEGYESNISNQWHVCQSKGVLEKRVLDSIKSNLQVE